MPDSPLRESLRARRPSFGTWVQTPHPVVAEVLAGCGFDWLAVDGEHTEIDVAGFAALARGCTGAASPLARVRQNDTLAIRQMLDAGAEGVIVPLVHDADQARRAVAAARFPPDGVRGYSYCRANRYGRGFAEWAASANETTAVLVMIESVRGVENVEAILQVDGVDGVFVGPYDLSGSFGRPGRTDAPEVRQALRRVAEACDQAGKSAGMHVVEPDPAAIDDALAAGYTFLALGMDTVFLRAGADAALAAARGFMNE